MKYLLALLALISCFGCAHTRVESWNDHTMTVCGNKRADLSDLLDKAELNGCKEAKPLRGQSNEASDKKEYCVAMECK